MTYPFVDRLRGQRIPGPVLLLGVAVGYLGLAQYVYWLDDPTNLGAGFWPAAGFSLGMLLLVSPSRWGWVLAGIGGRRIRRRSAPRQPARRFALLDRWQLHRTAGRRDVAPSMGQPLGCAGPPPPAAPIPRSRGRVGPLVGASIVWVGSVVALGHLGGWETWPTYVVGDGVGVLVIAPMFLCWKEQRIACHIGETRDARRGAARGDVLDVRHLG